MLTGTEDRQHAYVALTRGTHDNTAYVFTTHPSSPTRRPAPARPPNSPATTASPPRHGQRPRDATSRHAKDPLAVLAEIIDRDGQAPVRVPDLAAGPGRRRPPRHPARDLDRRDHPRPRAALPAPAHGRAPARLPAEPSHQAQVAVAHAARRRARRPGRPPGPRRRGRRAGPDRRPRHRRRHRRPHPPPHRHPRPAPGLPVVGPGPRHHRSRTRRAYAAEIAALMDARKERIGEHAATGTLPWAVTALGPVPADPAARLDWQQQAASIGAYRELSGYTHPADPIGPEPADQHPGPARRLARGPGRPRPCRRPRRPRHDRRPAAPPARHLPHRNRLGAALGRRPAPPGPRRRPRRPPGRAPRHRRSRRGRRRGEHEQAARQQALAASYQAMHDAYREHETVLPRPWPTARLGTATRHQRQLAVAADAELRRRHPAQPWPPLRSTEPEPLPSRPIAPGADTKEMARQERTLTAQHREFTARLAGRQSRLIPAADPDLAHIGPAFPAWRSPARDAILQPPQPPIPPSQRVLDRAADRAPGIEAAD